METAKGVYAVDLNVCGSLSLVAATMISPGERKYFEFNLHPKSYIKIRRKYCNKITCASAACSIALTGHGRRIELWLKEVLPAMKTQGSGQLAVVSSVAGLRTPARCSVYSGTKWALQGMVGSVREELKNTGIKLINKRAISWR